MRSFFLPLLLIAGLLHAEGPSYTESKCCPEDPRMNPDYLTGGCSTCACDPCCCSSCDTQRPCPPSNCAYNCPSFYDLTCSWDIGIYGAFLYFQAKEEGLEAASVIQLNNETQTVDTTVVNMNFDYKPAFRVGLVANSCTDYWTMYAEYLWYHTTNGKASKKFEQETSVLLQTNNYWAGIASRDFTQFSSISHCNTYEVSSNWKIDLDIVDLQIARKYFVGQCLVFNTHTGLRGLWLSQRYQAKYFCQDDEITTKIDANNHFSSWGIGVRSGLDTSWNFCCGFRFIANANVSILYTDYDSITSSFTAEITDAIETTTEQGNLRESLCFLRPEADLAIGLGFGDYFCCNRFYFDMAFAYELHVFWDQNMLLNSSDYSISPSSLRGNLYLHGLSITARIDF